MYRVPLTQKKHIGPRKYSATLEQLYIDELRDIAAALFIGLPGGCTKKKMAAIIADEVLNRPETLVKVAFSYELKAVLDYAEGRITSYETYSSGLGYGLDFFRLFYFVRSGYYAHLLYLHKDVAEKLVPLIPAELERREKNGELMFEKLVLGCSNICGHTKFEFFKEHYLQEFLRRNGIEQLSEEHHKLFTPFISRSFTNTKHKFKGILFSPFMSAYPDRIEYDLCNSIDPPVYDFNTVLGFGEMPYPVINFPGAEGLIEEYKRKFKSEYTVKSKLRNEFLLTQSQNMIDLESLLDLWEYYEDEGYKTEDGFDDEWLTFRNNEPFWSFNGRSRSEIMSKLNELVAEYRRNGTMPKASGFLAKMQAVAKKIIKEEDNLDDL